MSIKPVAAFMVFCDRCGTMFEDGDYTIFCDAPYYGDADWWEKSTEIPDGGATVEHFCSRCHTGRWPTDAELDAGAEDEQIRAVLPVPDPHPVVRNPDWRPTPGETCRADGCGLRADHAVHATEGAPPCPTT